MAPPTIFALQPLTQVTMNPMPNSTTDPTVVQSHSESVIGQSLKVIRVGLLCRRAAASLR